MHMWNHNLIQYFRKASKRQGTTIKDGQNSPAMFSLQPKTPIDSDMFFYKLEWFYMILCMITLVSCTPIASPQSEGAVVARPPLNHASPANVFVGCPPDRQEPDRKRTKNNAFDQWC